MSQILQRKYGMTPGQAEAANVRMTEWRRRLASTTTSTRSRAGNSFDAHRLIHLAARHGLGDAMKERLLAAYFTEGLPVGDRPTLAKLAGEVGLDPHEAETTLNGDDFSAEVREDEARAAALGVRGVPFFVIDEAYGLSARNRPTCCSEPWNGRGPSPTGPPRAPPWMPTPPDRAARTGSARSNRCAEPVCPVQVPSIP